MPYQMVAKLAEAQTHRSAWTPEDFTDWEIEVLPRFHLTDAKRRALPEPIGALWATRRA